MGDIAVKVEGIGKKYQIGRQSATSISDHVRNWFAKEKPDETSEFWALKDVSFEIKKGEAVGIIGENGAGKSTLLKILSKITYPTTGRFEMSGRVSSLLEVGTGFHPELSGRENIFLNGTILGMTRAEIKSKFDEIVAFSGVEKFIDTPVKHYSSGMYVRLAFSVAAHLEPEILIIDEVLAVGDAEFQKKCLGKMDEVAKQGRTVLFVSHNMGAVKKLCDTGILLAGGEVSLQGGTGKVLEYYQSSQESIKYSHRINLEALDQLNTQGFQLKKAIVENLTNPGKDIRSGDDLKLIFTYYSDGKIASPAIVLIFKNNEGVEIFRLSTMPISGFKIQQGQGEKSVSITLPRIPMVKGVYYIDFGFVHERVEWIARAEMLIRLEIEGKDVYDSGFILDSNRGMIWVDHKWHYE